MAALAALAAPVCLSASTRSTQAPGLDDIVNAVRRFVSAYEDKLTLIVSDESYVQHAIEFGARSASSPVLMKSEMFFAFTPKTKEWLAVRDIKSVNGQAVKKGPDVGSLLSTMPAKVAASVVKLYNSRYNVGYIVRNYNEPTLSLLLFDVNWHEDLEFRLEHIDDDHGVAVATIAFRERSAPTLIVDLSQQPVLSSGEAVVETETGRVRKILFKSPIDNVVSELETTYALDRKLGAWVPETFVEHYVSAGGEEVVCRATYSNFRRFEVHGGIK
jgi:hypothetical protein